MTANRPQRVQPAVPAASSGGGEALYAARVKIQTRAVSGRFRNAKWAVMAVLLGIYWLVPFLRWDRGPGAPDQAVLIDLHGQRAYFFFVEIWPQEVYYLTGLLIAAAVGLFLATALFGRVWCGFACPQTVWTDLFMWVERLIEGDRNARLKLDRAPLSFGKIWKRTAKHAAWIGISAATGGAFVLYFADAPTAVIEFATLDATPAMWTTLGTLTATTYLMAGWAREQVCTYACPWPRIQAAMIDEDSLTVTYQAWRGEPRGKLRKSEALDRKGDCVDCFKCVQVCPMGIDIRNGPQMECIGCGLCIDACDSTMDVVGLARGLIRYDSEYNIRAREVSRPTRVRLVRPRTVAYVVLIVLIALGMVWALSSRATFEMTVLRDRSPLFVTLSDGSIRNGYDVKIRNKTHEERRYRLDIEGLERPDVSVDGDGGAQFLPAKPDDVTAYRVFVRVPPGEAKGSVPVTFVLREEESGRTTRTGSVFIAPGG